MRRDSRGCVLAALLAALAPGCDSGGNTPEDPTTVVGSTGEGSSSTDDSGSTSGPPETTGPAPTSTPPPTSDTVTVSETSDSGPPGGGLSFADDIRPIFEAANCARTTCHGAQFPEVTEYFAIVDAPSTVAGVDLVSPGSREDSYLWHRINGTGSEVGGLDALMPPGGGLSADDIERIGMWIDAGASP